MGCKVFLTLRCYISLLLLQLSNGFTPQIIKVPWIERGSWGESRSIIQTTHFSCDFEVPEVIDHYMLIVNSSNLMLDSLQTWSLKTLSSNDYVVSYQNTVPLYPPRVSLQFHVTTRFTFGLLAGTCELATLEVPLRLRTTPSFLSTDNWNNIDGSRSSLCVELSEVFPTLYYEHNLPPEPYQPPEASTFPGWDNQRARGSRKKRFASIGNDRGPPHTGLLIPTVTYNYTEAIRLSVKFYEAQRSGNLKTLRIGGPNAWLESSGMFHTAPDGSDLTGGWYNGNDNVKLSLPMASATTLLAWGFHTWNYTYTINGLDQELKNNLKWSLDYFLKSWKPDEEKLYVQVGDLNLERTLFVKADNPKYLELWNSGQWPVYSVDATHPGSDVAAEIATAMAISSQLDLAGQAYSDKLLQTATQLYAFAKKYRGKYSDHVPVSGHGYPDYTSTDYNDELCLAAMTLKEVSPGGGYLKNGKKFFDESVSVDSTSFDWNNKRVACAIKLYKETGSDQYKNVIEQFRQHWMNTDQGITPYGLAWKTEKGTLSHTANAVFILLQAIEVSVFDKTEIQEIRAWCVRQMNYMLGRNNMHRSYQIGYPTATSSDIVNPYHKNSACPDLPGECGQTFYESSDNNTNLLVGALVGGPDLNDYHNDVRTNHFGNSVALDYNAGFQSALVGIENMYDEFKYTCESSVPPRPTSFDYIDALRKSIMFYSAQRSSLVEPPNNPVTWRQWGGSYFEGGWYDDGSSVRTTKLMAGSTYILGWGMMTFRQGYEITGTLDEAYDQMQWALTYLNKIYDTSKNALLQKVGNEARERGSWSRPSDSTSITKMEDTTYISTLHGTGADVAADVVTALAVGSVLFREKNATFSDSLKTTAQKVYDLATQLTSTYSDASSWYYTEPGDSYDDEMCIATWWLFKATNDISYYPTGINYRNTIKTRNVLDWKDRHSLCLVLLYEQTGDSRLSLLLSNSMTYWEGNNNGVHYTPQGLAWHDTEPLKYAANAAFMQALAKTYGVSTIQNKQQFSKTQIDYMLGNNDNSYSYQVGYGSRYPRRIHHRASSCPDTMRVCDWRVYNRPGRNPHELIGALVAGPDMNDVFEDVRSNYTMTRVSIEANAGFQSVLACM
ncbi:hypothetical protein ACF0H5_019505 [Mactra antiquata]